MKPLALAALLAAFATPPPAAALDTVDDWRKVGPVEEGSPPEAKAYLSPRAAAELMAAVDAAWRRGTVFHAQAVGLERIVQNLRWVFRTKDDVPAPAAGETNTFLETQLEKAKAVAVLGFRPSGAFRLLVVSIDVVYNELAPGFDRGIFGIVLDAKGRVTDLAVLSWGIGDAGFLAGRYLEARGGVLQVTHYASDQGRLCELEEVEAMECFHMEGSTHDLDVGSAGRFQEKRRRPMNFSGQFIDGLTGEQLLVEDRGDENVRAAYRTRASPEWRALEVVKADRERRVLVVKFKTGPTAYALTLGADDAIVSKGSDGSKAQRFERVPVPERHRDE